MDSPGLNVIAMPRTGHRAVMQWLWRSSGGNPAVVRQPVMARKRTPTDFHIHNIEYKSFEDSMERAGSNGGPVVLLVRDYPNWIASILAWRGCLQEEQREGADLVALRLALNTDTDMYLTHLEAVGTVPTILYPQWVRAGHGEGIEVAGRPSRFEGGDPLHRYEQMADHEMYQEMMTREDAIAMSDRVFGCSNGTTTDGSRFAPPDGAGSFYHGNDSASLPSA